jgi:hypothetical protein
MDGLDSDYLDAAQECGDQKIVCVQCHNNFTWSVMEQEFYRGKGFDPPKRCPVCRRFRKAAREEKNRPGRNGPNSPLEGQG